MLNQTLLPECWAHDNFSGGGGIGLNQSKAILGKTVSHPQRSRELFPFPTGLSGGPLLRLYWAASLWLLPA